MKAVGGDGDGAGPWRRVVEPYGDPGGILLDAHAAVAEMHGTGPQSVDDGVKQHLVKIAAMNREMRIRVTAKPPAWLGKDKLAVTIEIGEFAGFHAAGLQVRLDAKGGQHADCVGHHVDADTERSELGRRLKDPARQTAGMECER